MVFWHCYSHITLFPPKKRTAGALGASAAIGGPASPGRGPWLPAQLPTEVAGRRRLFGRFGWFINNLDYIWFIWYYIYIYIFDLYIYIYICDFIWFTWFYMALWISAGVLYIFLYGMYSNMSIPSSMKVSKAMGRTPNHPYPLYIWMFQEDTSIWGYSCF